MQDDFVFDHLKTTEDVEQHLELMREVFGRDSRVDLQVKKWIGNHPTLSLNDFFVMKHCGKPVACLNIIPSRWSIGGIDLKVSELGCVATLSEFRRRGLQKILQTEYHKQLSDQKYDLSAIEGIPYFYRQFGYEYALPLGEQTVLRIDKIPDYDIKHRVRHFKVRDISQASSLLRKSQEKFYVHSVREIDLWKMQQRTRMVAEYKFDGYAAEREGKMAAYFRTNYNSKEKELILREVTDVDQTMSHSVLSFLKNKGRQLGAEALVATISYREPFTTHMVALGGIKQFPPYAWQIKIMDYGEMFGKIRPLLEKRLSRSTYQHLTETLSFNFYRYTIQVQVKDGTITNIQRLDVNEDRTIRANPVVFTQLILGHRSRAELEKIYPDFIVRPSHKHLIDVMFPKMPSYIHTDY